MDSSLTLSDEDIKHLRSLIRYGRLFDVQQWITDGKPVFIPNAKSQQMLSLAVETGFHSLVEILAKVWPDHESMNHALQRAAYARRPDIVWLLLGAGADMDAVDLESIAQCYDRDLMRHYFEHWDQIDDKEKLLQVVTAKVQMLIGMIREYAPRLPNHEVELAMALKHFIDEGNAKWVSLTIWMGADPRLRVPDPRWSSRDEEWTPEDCSTPVEDAISKKRLDIIKLMKISPEKDDLNALLSHVYVRRDEGLEVAEYLIKLGANINNKPNGGSSVLDGLLGRWDFFWRSSPYESYASRISVSQVEEWIRRGARFVPEDNYDFRQFREAICSLYSSSAMDLLKKLAKVTEPHIFQKLVSTPKVREHIGLTSILPKNNTRTAYPQANRIIGRQRKKAW